jgi:hypothetical protein
MLRSFKALLGFALRATDGRCGIIRDVDFDDRSWQVRYCVIDSGRWLTGRHLLIGPRSLSVLDANRRELWVRLSRTEVERSRRAATDRPVSRQRRAEVISSLRRLTRRDANHPQSPHLDALDRHLRSCRAVLGHRVAASDGRIGHVDDFLIDDNTWTIQHLIIDSREYLPAGTHVLLAPRFVHSISWPKATVAVNMTRAAVATAPMYQADGWIGPSPDAA